MFVLSVVWAVSTSSFPVACLYAIVYIDDDMFESGGRGLPLGLLSWHAMVPNPVLSGNLVRRTCSFHCATVACRHVHRG